MNLSFRFSAFPLSCYSGRLEHLITGILSEEPGLSYSLYSSLSGEFLSA